MKRFRFRLERLLVIRQRESREAEQALARAILRSRQVAAFLERASAERAAFAAVLAERRARRMSVLEWALTARRHEALVQRERQALEALEAAQAEVARRRQELAEARKRERMLERLKERRAEEHRLAVAAWEQAQLDEIAQNLCREGGGLR